PFVSKNGGGLAVTWGNQVADIMRAVESHVAPVVSILTSRATPAFADLTSMLDRARVQIRSWDSAKVERGLAAMSAHGPGIAAVGAADRGLVTRLRASIPREGRCITAFRPLPGALGAAAVASRDLRRELGARRGERKAPPPVTVAVATVMSGVLNAARPVR